MPSDGGDKVAYYLTQGDRGRRQAKSVGSAETRHGTRSRRPSSPRAAVGALSLAAAGVLYAAGLVPLTLAGAYALMSVLSFLLYMKDKNAARRNTWRTPESTLHLLDILGGWPGGLVAQQSFRHKVSKTPFQVVFWLSVACNVGAAWWLVESGNAAHWSGRVLALLG